MKRNSIHVRRHDTVQVIVGKSRGLRGRVLRAMPSKNKVVVEGANEVWKHVRPSRENQRGGRIQIESPVDASNVRLLCQNRECERYDQPVRVRAGQDADGRKTRVCVKCGGVIVTPEA